MSILKKIFFATIVLLTSVGGVSFGATQTVTPSKTDFTVTPGDIIEFELGYSSDEPSKHTGLGLSVVFNAEKLRFKGFDSPLEKGLLAADLKAKPDSENVNGESSTNEVATIAWMSIDGDWLGENDLSTSLGIARFQVLEGLDSETIINIQGKAAANSKFIAEPVRVVANQSVSSAEITEGGSSQQKSGGSFSFLLLIFGLVLTGIKWILSSDDPECVNLFCTTQTEVN